MATFEDTVIETAAAATAGVEGYALAASSGLVTASDTRTGYAHTFAESASANATAYRFFGVKLADWVYASSASSFSWVVPVVESMSMSAVMAQNIRAIAHVPETITIYDIERLLFSARVSESLAAAASVAEIHRKLVSIAEGLSLSGVTTNFQHALQVVAEATVMMAGSGHAWGQRVLEALAVTGGATSTPAYLKVVLETVAASAVAERTLTVLLVASEPLVAAGNATTTARLLQAIREGITLAGVIRLDDETYDAWVVNTETFAGWKYENYPFNSFAFVAGKYYGMTDSGLYELDGDTDAGTSRELKNVPRAYIGYTSDGELLLRATAVRDGRKNSSYYKLAAHDVEAPDNAGAAFKREAISAYWQFDLENVDGSDFALHDLEIYWTPVNLRRRT